MPVMGSIMSKMLLVNTYILMLNIVGAAGLHPLRLASEL